LGVLSPDHPIAKKWLNPSILNCREVNTGFIRPTDSLYKGGAGLI